MRSILFFDLPSVTKAERTIYTKFVKNIKKLGFYMIQESVYAKMSINQLAFEGTLNSLKKIVPSNGSVLVLTITEKQFSQIKILSGELKSNVVSSDNRILVL